MYENNYLQIYVFLYTLYGGIVLGIVYDLINVVINPKSIKRRSISDLLFWAIAFSIIIGILFFVNNVNFRSYIVVGFVLGWFIYFLTLSKYIRKLLIIIKKMAKQIFSKIIVVVNIILFPVKKLLKQRKRAAMFIKKIKNKIVNDFEKYKTYLFKGWYFLCFPRIYEIIYLIFTKGKAAWWERKKRKKDLAKGCCCY